MASSATVGKVPGGSAPTEDQKHALREAFGLVGYTTGPGGGVGIAAVGSASLAFGDEVLPQPSGFDWAPPVSFWRKNGEVHHDFNPEDWMSVTSASLWVATTGNDSTGAGTFAAPYQSVGKAIGMMTGPTTIYVKAGVFNRLRGWADKSPAYDCNVIAVGGRAVLSTRWENSGPYTLLDTDTYEFSRSAVASVLDRKYRNVRGTFQRLQKVASLEACKALAGSWATNGTLAWLHLSDGRAPDADVTPMLGVSQGNIATGVKLYVRGITFEGGAANAFRSSNATVTADTVVVFDRCEFNYSCATDNSVGNGLGMTGVPLVIAYKCAAIGNAADGFNYHGGSENLIDTKSIEIDCRAFDNGLNDGLKNDNGSTLHGNCRAVRLRTIAGANYGPTITDVGTSKSWNIDCTDLGSTSAPGVSNTGFYVSDTAQQWLDHCQSVGSAQQVYAGPTSAQYQRLMTFVGPAAY